jgi:hypothetical protein
MNRIIPISAILAVAGFVGLAIEANAADPATSTTTVTLPATCGVTAAPGTLVATPNTINGGNFPTELTSTASPGKFITICSSTSSKIEIEVTSLSSPLAQGGSPYTATYNLSATGSSAYVNNPILGNDIPGTTITTGTIAHAFNSPPSELIVSGKLKATPGKILGKGTYSIAITATLTPQ